VYIAIIVTYFLLRYAAHTDFLFMIIFIHWSDKISSK